MTRSGDGDGDVTVWFVGVSTGRSTIRHLLPAWAPFLGRRATVVGHDLPIDAPADAYVTLLDELGLASGGDLAGAVVTSHKVRLLAAGRDRFRRLDPLAALLGEVSVVRPHAGRFDGFSRDAIAIRRTLDDTFGSDAPIADEVICFGAGGSGRALLLALMTEGWEEAPPFRPRPGRPRVVHVVDRDPARLAESAAVARRVGVPEDAVQLHRLEGGPAARDLVAGLAPGSLVVNATGLGKDRPGSPVPSATVFPPDAIAWDFNYRGDLRFLDTAGAQRDRGVQVMDGWRLFLHGWVEALAPLLGTDLDDAAFARLAEASEPHRPDDSRARARLAPGVDLGASADA